jgi:hypothetical protein
MVRPGNTVETEITHSTVRDAILQIMQGDHRTGSVDARRAADVAARITGSVQKMGFRGASSALLSGNAAFHTLVTQHLGSPAAAAYDPVFRQQLQQAIEKANITGSDYIAGVKAGIQIGLAQYAKLNDGSVSDASGSGEGRRSASQPYNAELLTNYTASNLSPGLRGLVDTNRGFTAGHVAEAANFAQRIGLEPGPYTGYFTGSSQSIRTAIERHVKSGDKITDDHLKDPHDVKAVLGAIKAGKMKKEDAPPAMQKIIKDMESKGIKLDSADHKAVEKYLQDNPKILEQVKKANDKDIAAEAGKGQSELDAKTAALAAKAEKRPTKPAVPSAGPAVAAKL